MASTSCSSSTAGMLPGTMKLGEMRSEYWPFSPAPSEKLGSGKKAMAVSFTFLDETKTFTDTEIDSFMQKIIGKYEKEISAEIRK